MRRNAAVESNAVEPNAVESNAVESNAVESNAVESNAIKSNAVKSNAVESKKKRPSKAELREHWATICRKHDMKLLNVYKYITAYLQESHDTYSRKQDKEAKKIVLVELQSEEFAMGMGTCSGAAMKFRREDEALYKDLIKYCFELARNELRTAAQPTHTPRTSQIRLTTRKRPCNSSGTPSKRHKIDEDHDCSPK
jgi:hypothetical protein